MLVVRASITSGYTDCPRRAATQILAGQIAGPFGLAPSRAHVGALAGTAVHAANNAALAEKVKTGALAPADACDDAAVEALHTGLREAEAVTFDDDSPSMHAAEATVLRQVAMYRSAVAERIDPEAVEMRVEAETPERDIAISGQPDVLCRDGTLRDTKTGRRRVNAAQYGTYSRLLRSNGRPVLAIVEDHLERVHPSRPQPPLEQIPVDLDTAEAMSAAALARIIADLRAWSRLGTPEVFPANPLSNLCSPKFCRAWGSRWCSAWRLK